MIIKFLNIILLNYKSNVQLSLYVFLYASTYNNVECIYIGVYIMLRKKKESTK